MKVLILRFSSIGDIVLTTPVIRNLKNQYPEAQIHYCTKDRFKGILEHNPYIDKLHLLKDDLSELISDLKKENFDLIIDLHRNLRTLIIKTRLGKKSYSFDKLNFKKWLLVRLKINKLPDIHIVDRYMATLKYLNIQNDNQGLDYFIPAKDEVSIQSLPASHQHGFIAFAIGAQHNTKKLPKERMAELCLQLTSPVILLGDKNDKAAGDFVEEAVRGTLPVYNACGLYNLNQSASLLKSAEYVISHDTGLMHIASALKKPIISIWGNTVPEFGMYPYQTKFKVIEHKNLPCRPCSKIGYKECPQGHFKCMRELDLREVTFTEPHQNSAIQ